MIFVIVKLGYVYVLVLINVFRFVMYMYIKFFNWLQDICMENFFENSLVDLNKIVIIVLFIFG